MTIERINTGASPNDGTGDTLRAAFQKVNNNLDVLAAAVAARLLQHWAFAPLHHDHENCVARYVNDSPPAEPPPMFGAMWIDVSTNRIYLGTGTADVTDWREVAFVS